MQTAINHIRDTLRIHESTKLQHEIQIVLSRLELYPNYFDMRKALHNLCCQLYENPITDNQIVEVETLLSKTKRLFK